MPFRFLWATLYKEVLLGFAVITVCPHKKMEPIFGDISVFVKTQGSIQNFNFSSFIWHQIYYKMTMNDQVQTTLKHDMSHLHLFKIMHLLEFVIPTFLLQQCIDPEQIQMWHGIFRLPALSHPWPCHRVFGITMKEEKWKFSMIYWPLKKGLF